MATEDTTKISGLVATNPESTDPVSKGDNHLRMIKDVLKKSFPSDIQVHIPNTEGQDSKFLVVDGTNPTWQDPIDWRATMGMIGAYMRSRFSWVNDNTLRVWPGSYDVAGVGTVNLDWTAADSPIDIAVTGSPEGWNYIYIDQSEVSSAVSADPYARVSITEATSADFLGRSSTSPVYNPMKRGYYINEEDRVIFAYYYEGGAMVKFFHDGGTMVHWADAYYNGNHTAQGQVTHTAHAPNFSSLAEVRAVVRDLSTSVGVCTYTIRSISGGTGTLMTQTEGGGGSNDSESNSFGGTIGLTSGKFYTHKTGGDTNVSCKVYTRGFYLPNGI